MSKLNFNPAAFGSIKSKNPNYEPPASKDRGAGSISDEKYGPKKTYIPKDLDLPQYQPPQKGGFIG